MKKPSVELKKINPNKKIKETGMIGYSKDAKCRTNPAGLSFEIIWEERNKCLRVYTSNSLTGGCYRYLNLEQTKGLMEQLVNVELLRKSMLYAD